MKEELDMEQKSIEKKITSLFLCMVMVLSIACAPVCTSTVLATEDYPGNPTWRNDVSTWDCIWFGRYYQSNSTTKEPIKWRVLKVEGNDAYIISDKNLDCQPYNKKYTDVTWETCSLRNWLNTSFYTTAFSESERSAIIKTHVSTDPNSYSNMDDVSEYAPGAKTDDKIYLLSLEESVRSELGFTETYLEDLLETHYDSTRQAENTAYAKQQGAVPDPDNWREWMGTDNWWLRSPGGLSNLAAYIHGNSGHFEVEGTSVDFDRHAVRPVLHIDLSSSEWCYAGTVSSDGKVHEVVDKLQVRRVDAYGYVTPIAGKEPSKPTIPADADYSVDRLWYEVPEIGNKTDAKELLGKFEEGKVYCLALTFRTAGENKFDEDVKVYVDGKSVEYDRIADNKIRAYIYATADHDFSVKDVTPATLKTNGKIETKCKYCGEVSTTKTIYAAKTVKLSAAAYTYTGKPKKPSVIVKDSKGNTISKANYTVTYASGRTKVGKYRVKITFKGNYKGYKYLYFKINPPKTGISSLTAGSKGFTAKWTKKSSQVNGYQIQYSTSSTFKASVTKMATVTSYKTVSKTIKSLKANQKYYVRIRTYKKVGTATYYSAWSAKKYITTKA